jgi:glycosyltransferase involved in cell wall biosynthesis
MGRVGLIRVGIDGFNLAIREGTGVATYAHALAEACGHLGRPVDLVYGLDVPAAASPGERETLFFAALADGPGRDAPAPRRSILRGLRRGLLRPGVRGLVDIPLSGRVIRNGIAPAMPAFDRLFTCRALFPLGERYFRRFGRFMPVAMADPPDIMHWTYPVPVRLVGSRNVYTIHDLVPLRLPFLSLEDKRYHERLLRACVAQAAHILTVSERSRADILDILSVDAERVTNGYQALPAGRGSLHAGEDHSSTLQSLFDLAADGYFLFFGAIEPKKNLGRLIDAYLTSGLDTPLVIAGPDAWRSAEELRLLDSHGGVVARQAGRIRRVGYVRPAHLMALIAGARAVVFPSLYEGFGLPVLEAMTAGVPVIVSNEGALPEIVAGAGIEVDPYAVDAIRRALVMIDGDAGLRRAQDFTMAQYCTRMDAMHRRIMAMPRRPVG